MKAESRFLNLLKNKIPSIILSDPITRQELNFAKKNISYFFNTTEEKLDIIPELFIFGPEKSEKVEDTRNNIIKIQNTNTKVVLFTNPYKLNDFSQNSLLKILEDNPREMSFVFAGGEFGIDSNRYLLETIVSRSIVLHIPPLEEKEEETSKTFLESLVADFLNSKNEIEKMYIIEKIFQQEKDGDNNSYLIKNFIYNLKKSSLNPKQMKEAIRLEELINKNINKKTILMSLAINI